MIVVVGEAILREKVKSVPKKDIGSLKLKRIISTMEKALNTAQHGVAIAAPQVGVPLRLFLVSGRAFDLDSDEVEHPSMVFINPELLRKSRKMEDMSEGCLSVPHAFGMVRRHVKASVTAVNEKGVPFTYHGSGLVAQIFQHEIDHLNGILYIDKAKNITYESKEGAQTEL